MKSSIVGRFVDQAVVGAGAKLGMVAPFFAPSAASAVPAQSAAAKMQSFAEIRENIRHSSRYLGFGASIPNAADPCAAGMKLPSFKLDQNRPDNCAGRPCFSGRWAVEYPMLTHGTVAECGLKLRPGCSTAGL